MNKMTKLDGMICRKCETLCVFSSRGHTIAAPKCFSCGNEEMERCLPLTEPQFRRMAALLQLSMLTESPRFTDRLSSIER